MADPLDLDAIEARYENGGWEVFTTDVGVVERGFLIATEAS